MAGEPLRGEGAFTRQQLAVLTQLLEAWAVERSEEIDPGALIPGTVESYDPLSRMTSLAIDGDTGSTLAFNKQYVQLAPGDRVFIEFTRTGGAFVDGIIRAAGALGAGCTVRTDIDGVEFPEETVAPAVDMVPDYDPFSMYDPTNGVVTIPEYGLWSMSFVTFHVGTGFTRTFCQIRADGFAYRGSNYYVGAESDPNNHANAGPMFLPAGHEVELELYHEGIGGPASFLMRADVYKVQPGQFTPQTG